MRVEFFEDAIGIYDGDEEIVYWVQEEWVEDPSVVFSITNAVLLAVTDPDRVREIHEDWGL